MSAIERMKNEISRKAEKEAKRIVEKAEKEAEAIIEKAYRESKDAEERVKRKLAPELRRVRSEVIGAAVSENRKKLLNVKEALISDVFVRVEGEVTKLANDGGERYEELIIRLIEEGTRNIREQNIRVMANSRDSEFIRRHINMVRSSLKERLGWNVEVNLSDNALTCIGGVIVSNMDGKIVYYDTLESRVAKMREKLRFDVAKILFGE